MQTFQQNLFCHFFWGGEKNTTSFLAIQKSISMTTLIMSLLSCWDGNCWERKQNVAWILSEDLNLLVLSFPLWAGCMTLTIWFFSSQVVEIVIVLAYCRVIFGRSTGRMCIKEFALPRPLCNRSCLGSINSLAASSIVRSHKFDHVISWVPTPFRMVTSSISFPASSPSWQEAHPQPHSILQSLIRSPSYV